MEKEEAAGDRKLNVKQRCTTARVTSGYFQLSAALINTSYSTVLNERKVIMPSVWPGLLAQVHSNLRRYTHVWSVNACSTVLGR